MRRSLTATIIVLVVLAAGSLVWAHPVSADLRQATIDPTATRALGGSYALVTGSVTCTSGESFRIVMNLGQSGAGAQAQGEAIGGCTGESIDWTVTALSTGDGALLQSGPARTCWNVATFQDGRTTDVRRGCSTVTLMTPLLEVAG